MIIKAINNHLTRCDKKYCCSDLLISNFMLSLVLPCISSVGESWLASPSSQSSPIAVCNICAQSYSYLTSCFVCYSMSSIEADMSSTLDIEWRLYSFPLVVILLTADVCDDENGIKWSHPGLTCFIWPIIDSKSSRLRIFSLKFLSSAIPVR